jgi:hypothetical protein
MIARVVCKKIEFISEDTNEKYTNITTIYNQYLIRNYLQKILKCHAAKFPFVRSMV